MEQHLNRKLLAVLKTKGSGETWQPWQPTPHSRNYKKKLLAVHKTKGSGETWWPTSPSRNYKKKLLAVHRTKVSGEIWRPTLHSKDNKKMTHLGVDTHQPWVQQWNAILSLGLKKKKKTTIKSTLSNWWFMPDYNLRLVKFYQTDKTNLGYKYLALLETRAQL